MHKLLLSSLLLVALLFNTAYAIPILRGIHPRYRQSANPEELVGGYGSADNAKMSVSKNMFIKNNFVRIAAEDAGVDNSDEFILVEQ